MEEKQYKVGANLLQEMVNYMQARPFVEVAGLMGKIISLLKEQNDSTSGQKEGANSEAQS